MEDDPDSDKRDLGASGAYDEDMANQDQQKRHSSTEPETSDRNSLHTSTKSLIGSVLDYPIENGRRYCGTGPDSYFMPNDDMEQTRLNIHHQLYLLILDGELTLAPISAEPERILDIGTGTGEWAIDMAERYPDADVTGTDLSAIQPDAVPSNVFFEVDDAEEEWTFSSPFDLIHLRGLTGSFRDWQEMYKECYRHLKPGGYIEIIDADHIEAANFAPNSYLAIFVGAIRQAAEKAGRPWGTSHLKRSLLENAGFTDIKQTVKSVPVGPWRDDQQQKTIGKMWLIVLLEAMEAGSLRLLTRELDWKAEEVLDLCEKLRGLLTANSLRMATPINFVVARKPLDAD